MFIVYHGTVLTLSLIAKYQYTLTALIYTQ